MNVYVSLPDETMPYPRVCAHRGFSELLPENSLVSFSAAIAVGVQEIEFDVWASADGKLVVCHDPNLERIALYQTGIVKDLKYEEILQADIGTKRTPLLKGLQVATLEEVLALNANRAIINMHIKSPEPEKGYDKAVFQKIVETIDRHESRRHVYISGAKDVLKMALEEAPDITRNCLERQEGPDIVDNAIKYKCKKLQFLRSGYSRETINRAHQKGIICNYCNTENPDEARKLFDMGIDTVLTNSCWLILQELKQCRIT
jgi:glycerophosphoryl diester phosphodiesterase